MKYAVIESERNLLGKSLKAYDFGNVVALICAKYNFSEECIRVFCEVRNGRFLYSIYAFKTRIAVLEPG